MCCRGKYVRFCEEYAYVCVFMRFLAPMCVSVRALSMTNYAYLCACDPRTGLNCHHYVVLSTFETPYRSELSPLWGFEHIGKHRRDGDPLARAEGLGLLS